MSTQAGGSVQSLPGGLCELIVLYTLDLNVHKGVRSGRFQRVLRFKYHLWFKSSSQKLGLMLFRLEV